MEPRAFLHTPVHDLGPPDTHELLDAARECPLNGSRELARVLANDEQQHGGQINCSEGNDMARLDRPVDVDRVKISQLLAAIPTMLFPDKYQWCSKRRNALYVGKRSEKQANYLRNLGFLAVPDGLDPGVNDMDLAARRPIELEDMSMSSVTKWIARLRDRAGRGTDHVRVDGEAQKRKQNVEADVVALPRDGEKHALALLDGEIRQAPDGFDGYFQIF
ncbi:hypothetical protein GGF32_000023 [Allomyces javanicus]|nr:hypothetical protein GGF32_000023 [Allomyces javanicus]